MIASAASQHPARLERLMTALSRTLPPTALHEIPPLGRRPMEARRFGMSIGFSLAARAYSALKATLAAIGLAALAAFFALPAKRDALLSHIPVLAMPAWTGPFSAPPIVTAGPIQGPATARLREREQHALSE